MRDRPGWLPRPRCFDDVAALQALADAGSLDRSQVAPAMARYGIAPDQRNPWDRCSGGSSSNVEDHQPMRLYLVQHGQAWPAAEHPDRPRAGARLKPWPRLPRIVHSGKTRARQTAEMLADHLTPGQPVEAAAGLDPNDPVEPWVATVNGWTDDGLLVGHQPFLGQLVSRLVLGEERALVDYRPGTAVCPHGHRCLADRRHARPGAAVAAGVLVGMLGGDLNRKPANLQSSGFFDRD